MPSPNPRPKSLFPVRRPSALESGIVVGPESTRDYMRRVNVAYQSLNVDITRAWTSHPTKLHPDFFQSWNAQLLAWSRFYDDHIDGVTTGWTASEYNETEKYEQSLQGYRAEYVRQTGLRPSGPEAPRGQSESDPLNSVVSILKWGVIGYLAIQIVGAVRK